MSGLCVSRHHMYMIRPTGFQPLCIFVFPAAVFARVVPGRSLTAASARQVRGDVLEHP